MHTLLLSRILTLWMFAESFVNGALTITYSGSKEIGSTTYSLKCEVPGFSGQAVWNIGTVSITCLTATCIPDSRPPYTFSQNGTAIYATFSVLAADEDGKRWSCEHATDTTVFFDVEVDFGSSGSGGGSTGLKWLWILLAVLGGIVVFLIIGGIIKFCCISNTRCTGQESKVNITPNESRVNITSNEHIEIPTSKSEPHKKEVTPYQDGKDTIIPTNKSSYKEVTPNQVDILNNKLNIVKSSIAATPPRSGSKQPLHPLNKGGDGNLNGDDLPF